MPYAPAHIAAQQAGLLAEVGTWPGAGTFRLYAGDPIEGGVEVALTAGYSRLSVSSISWAADSGEPSVSADLNWTATADWEDVADHWAVHDADGSLRFYEELPDPLEVDAAGPVSTVLTVYYAADYEV